MASNETVVTPSFACPDWEDRVKAGHSLMPDLAMFGTDAARQAQGLWRSLRNVEKPGAPRFESDYAGHPFDEFVYYLFIMNGRRRLARESFLLFPKQSGLAVGIAGLALANLLITKRPNADFALVGPTTEIASRMFEVIEWMVGADKQLAEQFIVRRHMREIERRENSARVRVVAFGSSSLVGARLSGAFLHQMQYIRAESAIASMRMLREALVPIDDSFLIMSGHQSPAAPSGLFRRELNRARAVRDGTFHADLLPIIYEPPADMDWWNPDNFKRLHPGIGYTLSKEGLEELLVSAEAHGYLEEWAAQWLNVEVRVKLQTDGYAGKHRENRAKS